MTDVTRVTKADIDAIVEGETVASGFAATVAALGDRVALRWRDGDDWASLTWNELADRACRVAAGLRSLGVGRGDRVALMMRNTPGFHVADLGALLVGATPFSVYNSSSAEQVAYLVGHATPKVAVVEADFAPRFEASPVHAVGVDDLAGHDPVDLDEASRIAQPDDLATLIYTSGTTGPPKGVMITHYNVCWTNEALLQSFDRPRDELVGWRVVSYLPMAHIAERQTSHYGLVLAGYEVTTCPDASQIAAYLRDVRPQLAFGVPRVWEKVQAGVEAALSADPEQKRHFDEAVAAATPLVAKRTLQGDGALTGEERETLAFLDGVAFAKVRSLVGLDALEYAITGAAPIAVELVEWYRAVGVPFSEIYGMSENTGPLTWDPVRVKPGYVGRELPGVTVRLAEDGEVLASGGNIFTGYLGDPAKTADALDADGWLHTGDIGELDADGYLRIVDRKKELIITAGGKNVSPANIEAALKSFPLIGQAAVIGDKRPYITALLVLDPDVAPGWAKQHGVDGAPTLAELAQHPEVAAEIERNVAAANARFSQVEQVKRYCILGTEWLPDSAELTPTMKLKRRGVNERYAVEIEALYPPR
jgi:long-chain acyl-CoA synthetase